jgi:hypothetical protein
MCAQKNFRRAVRLSELIAGVVETPPGSGSPCRMTRRPFDADFSRPQRGALIRKVLVSGAGTSVAALPRPAAAPGRKIAERIAWRSFILKLCPTERHSKGVRRDNERHRRLADYAGKGLCLFIQALRILRAGWHCANRYFRLFLGCGCCAPEHGLTSLMDRGRPTPEPSCGTRADDSGDPWDGFARTSTGWSSLASLLELAPPRRMPRPWRPPSCGDGIAEV